jgi:hypothetical protein
MWGLRRSKEPYEFDDLARYNAEKARGLVHTPEWVKKMEAQQYRHDDEHMERLAKDEDTQGF